MSVQDQTPDRGPFDRFVEVVHTRVSRPAFFAVCLVIVVAWACSLPLFADAKAWQAVIHTVTSIVTLLLVALLENAGRRDAQANQEKLNRIAEALAAVIEAQATDENDLRARAQELRESVGLEDETGA